MNIFRADSYRLGLPQADVTGGERVHAGRIYQGPPLTRLGMLHRHLEGSGQG